MLVNVAPPSLLQCLKTCNSKGFQKHIAKGAPIVRHTIFIGRGIND